MAPTEVLEGAGPLLPLPTSSAHDELTPLTHGTGSFLTLMTTVHANTRRVLRARDAGAEHATPDRLVTSPPGGV